MWPNGLPLRECFRRTRIISHCSFRFVFMIGGPGTKRHWSVWRAEDTSRLDPVRFWPGSSPAWDESDARSRVEIGGVSESSPPHSNALESCLHEGRQDLQGSSSLGILVNISRPNQTRWNAKSSPKNFLDNSGSVSCVVLCLSLVSDRPALLIPPRLCVAALSQWTFLEC